jgi:hypothetical protein
MPSGEVADLDRLLVRQHGVIGRRQALRYLGSNAVWRRVASGRWGAAHRGVYVAHTGPVTEQQRLWIAVVAVGCGRPTYLGGLSALCREAGLPVPIRQAFRIDAAGRPRSGSEVHDPQLRLTVSV